METSTIIKHLTLADPTLGLIIDEIGPFAIDQHPNTVQALVSSIVSQQVSVHAARAIMGRVKSLVSDGSDMTPAWILQCSDEQFRAAGLSRAKVVYIKDLATHLVDGKLKLEELTNRSDEDVIAALIDVKGIGRWTAQMYLIFALDRQDVLPVADLGFRTAVKRHYKLDALPGAAYLDDLGAVWAPYRSIATWYLWRSLTKIPV